MADRRILHEDQQDRGKFRAREEFRCEPFGRLGGRCADNDDGVEPGCREIPVQRRVLANVVRDNRGLGPFDLDVLGCQRMQIRVSGHHQQTRTHADAIVTA